MQERPLTYLDNAATTRVAPEALEAMLPYFREAFANPASVHRPGVEASRGLERARAQVARALLADPAEVVLTSGGTESANLAVRGALLVRRREKDHLVTTAAEHPAVAETASALEAEGFRVTRLPVGRGGCITPDDVLRALGPRTGLVSVIHVGNELGGVNPVEEIARRVKEARPDVWVHSDGVQAFGRVPVDLSRGIDLYGISSHKIHGPKGIGALYIRRGVAIAPGIHGGGQEGGRRSGTPNVPGAVGFGVAAEIAIARRADAMARCRALKERLAAALAGLGGVIQSPADGAPTILHVAFPGGRAEHLLHALEAEGVVVSAGAACASRKTRRSPVLEAAGIAPALIDASLRISLSRETTEEDVERCADAFRSVLAAHAG